MQRDMDLIRSILLECEAAESGYAPDDVMRKARADPKYGYHCLLIVEAGLALGGEDGGVNADSPSGHIQRLTWAGHEFIDAARDNTKWAKVKKLAAAAGGAAFPVILKVLMDVTLEQMGIKPLGAPAP